MFVVRILEFQPFSEERALAHDSIVVDLVTTSDHDVERPCLMTIEDIPPHWVRSRKVVRAIVI